MATTPPIFSSSTARRQLWARWRARQLLLTTRLLSMLLLCSSSTPVVRAFTVGAPLTTTTTTKQRCLATTVLGPVARNGLAYEDIELGQGRRILPGDMVYCYYSGSFQKKASGPFEKTTKTVFDEISKSVIVITTVRYNAVGKK